jgi:hypothetical protein
VIKRLIFWIQFVQHLTLGYLIVEKFDDSRYRYNTDAMVPNFNLDIGDPMGLGTDGKIGIGYPMGSGTDGKIYRIGVGIGTRSYPSN